MTGLAVSLLVAFFHLISFGSRRDSEFWLAVLPAVLQTAFKEQNLEPDSVPDIPRTLSTCVARFSLDPVTTTYICCPACCCLSTPRPDGSFSTTCTWRSLEADDPCNEPLFEKSRGGKQTPRRIYEHQSVVDWWGRMISRPEVEALADDYPRSLLCCPQDASDPKPPARF